MFLKNRKLNRLPDYDYSQNVFYFVKFCVWGKECVLRNVREDVVDLSKAGIIVKECLNQISNHFKNCFVDISIVMPNHIHPIIGIDNNHVWNAHVRSIQIDRSKILLPKIIQQFKAASTRRIQKQTKLQTFKCQKSFYYHVIRNESSLEKNTYVYFK